MALKDTSLATANKLISEYGSNVTLTKTINTDRVYNPITDEFEGGGTQDISVVVKYVQSKLDVGDNELSQISSVNKVMLIEYRDEIANIDNTWKADGNKIYHIKTTSLQGQDILYRLYVGK